MAEDSHQLQHLLDNLEQMICWERSPMNSCCQVLNMLLNNLNTISLILMCFQIYEYGIDYVLDYLYMYIGKYVTGI